MQPGRSLYRRGMMNGCVHGLQGPARLKPEISKGRTGLQRTSSKTRARRSLGRRTEEPPIFAEAIRGAAIQKLKRDPDHQAA